MLVMRTLSRHGELHGYEIANAIQQISGEVLQVEEGTLYPALQRMLLKGWVTAEWGITASNRRARYYKLTASGRKQLAVELSRYERVSGAIQKVIHRAKEPLKRSDQMFGALWRRLKFLLKRKRFDEDLAEEMRLHLDLRALDEGGETAARLRFGNQTLLRETSREPLGLDLCGNPMARPSLRGARP